jgi:hypothetical protein
LEGVLAVLSHLLGNADYVADLGSAMSNNQIAKKWGVGKSTVEGHRSRVTGGHPVRAVSGDEYIRERDVSSDSSSDGSMGAEWIRQRPVTLGDAEAWVASSGKDPDDYTISVRTIAYGAGLWSNRMAATPKLGGRLKMPPADELIRVVDKWVPPKRVKRSYGGGDFVITPADPQFGKTDWNGDHKETIERMLGSYAAAAEFVEAYRPRQVIIAALGDDVENINSVSSQRGTNSLALTEQIRVARRVALEGLKMFAPLCEEVVYLAVPSNHGSVRIGPKAPENHVLDDYGIEIAEQLRDVAANSEKLSNVTVIVPEFNYESLAYRTSSGTTLGLAHGHQVQSADALGKWWAGQSHGRMPMAAADIALFGHWHSLRLQQSGDARWLFVSPAQDGGSSWFTNKTGERSRTGMLGFTTGDGSWDNLNIF